MKIAILGSCVTRDMVQYLPKDVTLTLYAARSSLASLVAEPVHVDENAIQGEHAFNRRAVYWDMMKLFWDKLALAKPDVLVVDFIDERFDLWKKGEQVVTRSNYLSLSGVEPSLLSEFELVRRESSQAHDLWKRSCDRFVQRLSSLCGQVILHRAVWAEAYYEDGQVREFNAKDRQIARSANTWLNEYYDYFEAVLPAVSEVRVPDKFCVSNYAHKWGRDFFHYGEAYYQRLADMVGPHLRSISSKLRESRVMTLQENIFQSSVERYDEARSLVRWPSVKYEWNSLQEFLVTEVIGSGIHTILLDDALLDIYIDIKKHAPAYVYLHGNCPRGSGFKLPVFSGSNVLGSLNVTKIVPSDPVLLMDESLELSWHAGSATCNIQTAYKAIFEKVFTWAAASEVVFWGGSGGGFAALYYSYFFAGSTALVWNPQTTILSYLPDAVGRYLTVAFGKTLDDGPQVFGDIEHDVARLYREGYRNRIIYIQNDEDWHVASHLVPLLEAVGVDSKRVLSASFEGLAAPNFYLFFGNFSKDHDPPSNREIHCALAECFSVHGNPSEFVFSRLINCRHCGSAAPKWLVDALVERRVEFFRVDWPHFRADPVLDIGAPYKVVLSTGLSVQASADGGVDWRMEFERDISSNIHDFYSLSHVGRLLCAYEELANPALLDAALDILRSFTAFIRDPDALKLIMTNRGYSSADHSMSIRANVLVKLFQVIGADEARRTVNRSLLESAASHLWDIGDFLADPANIYPSNHGIMACLTLAQVANAFGRLKYISEQYLRQASTSLMRLIKTSFDRDGWANENTVGYHSFILRLLRDYLEYCTRNSLGADEIKDIRGYLERGEQALSFCVRQDGSIPPIGDSPLYRPKITSINHSKLFAESGFLIVKDELLYLSLVCGSRSDNHKQVDDSSLTLHYGGEDLIIDGGSYCYDSTDPFRKYLVSFRGHSGLFSEAVADLSAKAYLHQRKYASIEEFADTADGRFAKARYGHGVDNIECERRVLVDHSGGVLIADRARADNPASLFYQSFMLAPHLKLVANTGSELVFEGERYGIVIAQFRAAECLVEHGQTEPKVAGWCSINWREKESTHQVRFLQQGGSAHYLTKVQVYERQKGLRGSEVSRHPSGRAVARLYA
ncbi:MAG: heparinase II/III family protein [Rhodocyclaceae bacterium]|nr:heparinase II/III family protein [Rhodocyclaceae bacterium]